MHLPVSRYHRYHQGVPTAWISLTISRHLALSAIALCKSSRQQLSVCTELKNVFAGRPIQECPCVVVHKRTLMMTLSFLCQQCSACLVCHTLIVSKTVGKWPYKCCFVGYCFQDLFKTVYGILVNLSSSFFCKYFIRVRAMQPYSSTDMTTDYFALQRSGSQTMMFNVKAETCHGIPPC